MIYTSLFKHRAPISIEQTDGDRRTPFRTETGIAVLEMAMVIGITIFLLVSIFEVGRYFTIRGTLTRGAQEGLKIAKVASGLRVDIEQLEIECSAVAQAERQACMDERYQEFVDARLAASEAAARFPLSALVGEQGTDSASVLRTFTINDGDLSFTGTPSASLSHSNLKALVLRPGDRGYLEALDDADSAEEIPHPNICSPSATTCSFPMRKRALGESLNNLYQDYPIVVVVEAQVEMLLPEFGVMNVRGIAAGYREVGSQLKTGRIPEGLDCVLTPADCASADFFINTSCECQCSKSQADCVNFELLNPDTCSCECTAQSQTDAACFGDAEFNNTSCSCECPNPQSCASGGTASPADGCMCQCDPSSTTCDDGFIAQTKPNSPTGECECVCGVDPAQCVGGQVFNQDACRCECNPPVSQPCPDGMVPFGCQCVCDVDCPPNHVAGDDCECVCNGDHDVNAAACQASGRTYDQASCSCAGCTNGKDPASCAPEQFNASNCSCFCPDAPCAGARTRAHCGAPCVCPDSVRQSCLAQMGQGAPVDWREASCTCANLNDDPIGL